MKSFVRRRFSIVALAAVIVLSALPLVGCEGEPPPSGNNASAPVNRPTTANSAPATNASAPPSPRAPLGMEDTIEGTVIGLVCYKENPKATPAEAKACATANAGRGGALGILGSDGTVYVDEVPDARITNGKLKFFIGEEVTVQGQMIGDAPDLGWDGVKVKKFKMGLARRKGAAPADTPRQMEATNSKKAAAPVKKP